MLDFLDILREQNLLQDQNNGLIMYADDQFICRQALQMTLLSAIPLQDRFKFFTNGQQVVQAVENILDSTDPTQTKQPISLIILDINMPIMDGMQTAKRVKQLYDEYNEILAKESYCAHGLVRPFLCHLT